MFIDITIRNENVMSGIMNMPPTSKTTFEMNVMPYTSKMTFDMNIMPSTSEVTGNMNGDY